MPQLELNCNGRDWKKQNKAEGELPLDCCKVVERADNSRERRTHGGKMKAVV